MSSIDKKSIAIPQITGHGLKNFEDSLGYFDKNFNDNLGKASVVDTPVDFISTYVAAHVQDTKFKSHYDKQMGELNWFERNIHLNSAKEQKLLNERAKKSQQDAMLVELAIRGTAFIGKVGFALVSNEFEKRKLAKTTYQILSYVSAENGEIPRHDKTIIERVMFDMPVSISRKTKIIKQSPPTSIVEIEHCESLSNFKSFVGNNIYRILHDKGHSDSKILSNHRHVFEIIGFESGKQLKEFIKFTQHEHAKLESKNANYQNIILSICNELSVSYGKTRENCIQNTMLLSSYDPYKSTRQRNQKLIITGIKIAGNIALSLETGSPVAISTAFALVQTLLVDEGNNKEMGLYQESFTKLLTKQGIEKNDVDKLIKQGEKAFKLAM